MPLGSLPLSGAVGRRARLTRNTPESSQLTSAVTR
jgi:hypothetical protein